MTELGTMPDSTPLSLFQEVSSELLQGPLASVLGRVQKCKQGVSALEEVGVLLVCV